MMSALPSTERKTSMPDLTRPKATCVLSSSGAGSRVMTTRDGDIDNTPARECRNALLSRSGAPVSTSTIINPASRRSLRNVSALNLSHVRGATESKTSTTTRRPLT